MSRRFQDVVIDVTPTLSTDIYADEDILFAETEIPAAVLDNGGSSILNSLVVIDKDDEGAAFDVYIMRSNVDISAANAAEAVADGDLDEILTKVSITAGDYVGLASGQIAIKGPSDSGMSVLLQPSDAESTSLYMFAVSQGTPTYATVSDLVLKLGFLRG